MTVSTIRIAHYRGKAEEARVVAESMSSPGARDTVLEVAAAWDRLADEEEKSQKTISPRRDLPSVKEQPRDGKVMMPPRG